MRGSYFFQIVFGLILVGALIALGVYVYNAGVAQGLVSATALPAPDGSAPLQPYWYPPYYRPWGFGCFGLIGPLLFLFLIFALLRGLFFRGWRHYGPGYGPGFGRWKWGGSPEQWKEGVPPMVAEWHRKLHGEKPESDSE